MTDQARAKRIVSRVTVSASKGDGASVYYQTVADRLAGRNVLLMKNLTTAREDLPIGYYYIWAERDGVATSPKTNPPYEIVKPTEDAITLSER